MLGSSSLSQIRFGPIVKIPVFTGITLRSFSMKKHLIFLGLAVLLLASCAAPTFDVSACVDVEPVGFWMGLWHGMIAPFTFIISLFTDSLQMYDVNNTGGWYDFGFVLGAGILFGGSGSGAGNRRWKGRRQG